MTNHKKAPPTAPHYDGSGHLDENHAQRLLELGREGAEVNPDAFVEATNTRDDLAEELAESAVASMNSGEEQLSEDLNADVDEERGGPFVDTSGGTEFADGTDASNIAEATREPFPTT